MDRNMIREIVQITIEELRRSGMLKSTGDLAYSEVSDLLKAFYRGDRKPEIVQALTTIQDEPYFEIIPLYYKQRKTIEKIAEILGVEVSTVTRNKKRLCLMIYELIR